MAYVLNANKAIEHAPAALKKELRDLLSGIKEDTIFADDSWKQTTTSIWKIKTSAENVTKIGNKSTDAKMIAGEGLHAIVGGYKINFLISGKKPGSKGGGDAITTRMQELASAWVMRRSIIDNKKYTTADSIRQDAKYKELLAIYPDVDEDDEWLQTFYGQQKIMLDKFSNADFSEFNREGGFMKFISDLCRDKYGITKKDSWDPADIWCIKNQNDAIKKITDCVNNTKKSQTIAELNAILISKFDKKEVVGISLKKLSGKVAHYEEYNIGKNHMYDDLTYHILRPACKIDLSFNNALKKFGTQDTVLAVAENNNSLFCKFQIKGNDTSTICNLKYESTASAATGARVGKAPVNLVALLFKDPEYNMSFENNNTKFPKTADEFIKVQQKYIAMFSRVSKKIKTVIIKNEEFVTNIKKGYKFCKPIAVSKLMQLSLCDEIFKLTDKKQNNFMTDLVFLAAKIGEGFGPFGKIY